MEYGLSGVVHQPSERGMAQQPPAVNSSSVSTESPYVQGTTRHTHTHTHSYTRCTAPPQPRSEPGAAQAAKHMINRHRGHVWLGQSTPNNTHSHTPHMYKVWKCQPHWPAIPPSAGTARPTPPRGRGPDNWKTKHIACHCTAGCTTVLRKIEKIL